MPTNSAQPVAASENGDVLMEIRPAQGRVGVGLVPRATRGPRRDRDIRWRCGDPPAATMTPQTPAATMMTLAPRI